MVLAFNALPPPLACLLNATFTARPVEPVIEDGPHLAACQRDDYGLGLLRRWYERSEPVCSPRATAEAPGSAVALHAIRQARHSGDDYYLEVWNSTLEGGRVHLNCAPAAALTQPALFSQQGGLKQYVARLDYTPSPTAALLSALRGPSASERRSTALWIDRDCLGPGNLYHCSADLINAFMLVRQLRLAPDATVLLFTDASPGLTKFGALWQALATRIHVASELPTLRLALPYSLAALQSGSNMMWKDFWFDDPCKSEAAQSHPAPPHRAASQPCRCARAVRPNLSQGPLRHTHAARRQVAEPLRAAGGRLDVTQRSLQHCRRLPSQCRSALPDSSEFAATLWAVCGCQHAPVELVCSRRSSEQRAAT